MRHWLKTKVKAGHPQAQEEGGKEGGRGGGGGRERLLQDVEQQFEVAVEEGYEAKDSYGCFHVLVHQVFDALVLDLRERGGNE